MNLIAAPVQIPGVSPGAQTGVEASAAIAAPGFLDLLAAALGQAASPEPDLALPFSPTVAEQEAAPTEDGGAEVQADESRIGIPVVPVGLPPAPVSVLTAATGQRKAVGDMPVQDETVVLPQVVTELAVPELHEAAARPAVPEQIEVPQDVVFSPGDLPTEEQIAQPGVPVRRLIEPSAPELPDAVRVTARTDAPPAVAAAPEPDGGRLDSRPDTNPDTARIPLSRDGAVRIAQSDGVLPARPEVRANAQPVRPYSPPLFAEAIREFVVEDEPAPGVPRQAAAVVDDGQKPSDAEVVVAAAGKVDPSGPQEVGRDVAVVRAEPRIAVPELHRRVIDQVVKEVRLTRLQDGSDLTVRLHPPELGSLRIRLVSDAQGVTSQIEAASPQVRNLLQAHLPMLMDALSNAGVRLDSVSVTSALTVGAWANGLAHEQSQQQAGRARRGQVAAELDSAALAGEQMAAYGPRESGAYNWLA